jgi:hypothetical protein
MASEVIGLKPMQLFLCGYLKGHVYSPLPKTLDDLKSNIDREIKNINKKTLKNIFENFGKNM